MKNKNTVYGSFSSTFTEDRLGNLCTQDAGIQTGPFGSQLHQKDYVLVGTPIITVEHLGENRIIHQDLPCVSNYDRERLSRYALRTGDIVFSRVGSVDRRSLVRQAEDGWLFSGRCLRVRPNRDKIDSGYLSYFLGLPAFQEHIRSVAVGATMSSLNTKLLSDVTILYPPLPEQRAIAHILGTLDDKIELNRRMNRTLEEMARAIFQDWFVDFGPVRAKLEGREAYLPSDLWDLFPDRLVDSDLGEIPEGWEVKALGDAVRILDNLRVPLNSRQRTQRKGRYRYYGAAGILDYVDDFLFDGVHVLTGEDGSVIDQSGHPVTQYVWGQFWVNNHAHVLKGKMGFCDEHIYLLVQAQDIGAFVTGAVQPKLSQSNLKLIPIVVPSTFLLEAFPTVVQPIFGAIRFNSDETFVLAAQRDVLLPELVSGEVKVRDFTARGVVT